MSISTPIIVMILTSICSAIASLLMKLGSENIVMKINYRGLISILKNWKLLLSVFIYISSAMMMIFILKYERLSLLYPISSLTYVFIAILSAWILKEHINKYKIIGISFVILGVVLVGL